MAPAESNVSAGACCAPPAADMTTSVKTKSLKLAGSCCSSDVAKPAQSVHGGLSDLIDRYDINAYAASVKVYAVKPR